jgi:hypothetical protein
LVGERRLVWGDLGLIGAKSFSWRTCSDQSLVFAEDEHVRALIVAVAKRTNKFRVAMLLTHINIGLSDDRVHRSPGEFQYSRAGATSTR